MNLESHVAVFEHNGTKGVINRRSFIGYPYRQSPIDAIRLYDATMILENNPPDKSEEPADHFYRVTNLICEYLSPRFKVRNARCLSLSLDSWQDETVTAKSIALIFRYPSMTFSYRLFDFLAGSHIPCPKFPERPHYRINWLMKKTLLPAIPNTTPYWYGDPVPLRNTVDTNEFLGYGVTPSFSEDSSLIAIRNHIYWTFAGGDIYSYNLLISWLAYPLVNQGKSTKKVLSIFAPRGSGKSRFFCSVLKTIYTRNYYQKISYSSNTPIEEKMVVFDGVGTIQSEDRNKRRYPHPTELTKILREKCEAHNIVCLDVNNSECYYPGDYCLIFQGDSVGYDNVLCQYVTLGNRVVAGTNDLSETTMSNDQLLHNYWYGLKMYSLFESSTAVSQFVGYLLNFSKSGNYIPF